MRLVERVEVIRKLEEWQVGKASAKELWEWALQIKEDGEPKDSVVQDVLDILADLPMDLVIVDDAQVLIEALQDNLDQVQLSQNLIWNYFDFLNTEPRKEALIDDPFYGPFCAPTY